VSAGDSLSTNSSGDKSMGHPLESEYANTSSMQSKAPAVVPIKVKRSLSQSATNSMGDRESGAQPKMCQSFHAPPDRLSDYSDRENTPTGDDVEHLSRSPMSGASMAVAPMVAAKPKPVAMIVAKSKQPSREGSPDIIDVEKHEAERNMDGYKSPVRSLEGFKYPLATGNGSLKRRTSDHIYDVPQMGPPRTVQNYVNYPPIAMPQMQPRLGSPLHVATGFTYPPQGGSPRSSQQNSPGGRTKKAPPPPPKRTASIKSMEINANMGAPSSSGPPVLSPPPIQQKPQMAQAQSLAFVNCVQSLSERFGKKSEDSSGEGTCSDGEDIGSAPPVAMEIIEPKISNYGLLGKNDKATSGEYMLQQRLKRDSSTSSSPSHNSVESAFGVRLRQAQTESQPQSQTDENSNFNGQPNQSSVNQTHGSVHNGNHSKDAQNCVQKTSDATHTKDVSVEKVRKDSSDSGRSVDLSASTSSLDSNTLPFANENVGTIKQRAQQAKPSLVMFMEGGENLPPPPPDSVEGQATVFSDNTDTMKRTPNKLPKPQQPTVQQLQQQPPLGPKPQLHQKPGAGVNGSSVHHGHQLTGAPGAPATPHAPGSPPTQPVYNASVTASYLPGSQNNSQSRGKI